MSIEKFLICSVHVILSKNKYCVTIEFLLFVVKMKSVESKTKKKKMLNLDGLWYAFMSGYTLKKNVTRWIWFMKNNLNCTENKLERETLLTYLK